MVSTIRRRRARPFRVRTLARDIPSRLPRGEQGRPDRFRYARSRSRHREHVGVLQGWSGQEELEKFVRSNPECTAAHDAIITPLTTMKWWFAPATEDPADVELAEAVQDQVDCMRGRSFREFIHEELSTRLIHGHATFEPVYEDGRLYDLASRPPETIRDVLIDEHGRPSGVRQTTGVELMIADGRCIHSIRNRRGADGRGVSAFRGAWRAGRFGEQVEQIANIAAEKNSVGVPTARFAAGASAKEVNDFMNAVEKLHANELVGLGLPDYVEEFKIEGLSGSTFPVMDLLARYDSRVLRALGVEFLAIGLTDTGSYAARTDASSEIVAVQKAHAIGLKELVDRQLVPWLILAATGRTDIPPDRWPRLEHDGLDVTNFREVGEFVVMLRNANIIKTTPADEVWLRGLGMMPERALEDIERDHESEPEPPPSDPPPQTPPPNDDEPEDEPMAASRKEVRRPIAASFRRPDAVSCAFEARRELTAAEQRVDFVRLSGALDHVVTDAGAAVSAARATWIDYLVARASELLEDPDATLDDLADIEIPDELVGPAEQALVDHLATLYTEGRESVKDEMGRGGVPVRPVAAALERPDPSNPDGVSDALGEQSRLSIRAVIGSLLGSFAKAIRDTLGMPGGTAARVGAIRERLDALSDASVEDEVRQATAEALNMGRQASLEEAEDAPEFAYFELSELMDQNTCQPCLELDGERFASMEEVVAADRYPPQSVCLGRSRCRGIVVGVLASEATVGR